MCEDTAVFNHDKRELSAHFRDRLKSLISRNNESVSSFARRCNLDRSALSQFLDKNSTRLPRSETLAAIASAENLSIDWLLGLSQDEIGIGEVSSGFDIEHAAAEQDRSLLAQWHTEAAGYKVRYAPSSLPDLVRTPAITRYEFEEKREISADEKTVFARQQLDYSRLPETDMEVVMPFQRLENLAAGVDVWDGLERGKRQAQIEHMANLIEELYPTFRLFLFDGRSHFISPFTVFGPKRAAIYLGDMYMVINSVEHIRQLTRRFDAAIKASVVSPDLTAGWLRQLRVG